MADTSLASALRSVYEANESGELADYRNLAAHRGVVGDSFRNALGPGQGYEVRVLLPDWVPEELADYPGAEAGPILRRYLDWGHSALERLREVAESGVGEQACRGTG